MNCIVLEEPRKLSLTSIAEPEPPGPNEALVSVQRVGICGTDISGYLGKHPYFNYPLIPGHELGVEVLAVGSEVDTVSVGDRCSVEPYMNDPASFASRRGRSNCCNRLQVLGVHCDGGMRERFVLPAGKLHSSAILSMEQLALVETLTIGCHAVDRAGISPGEHLLLIGAGPIGLSVLEFARLAGGHITVMDRNAERLRFCSETMGVDYTVEFCGEGAETVRLQEITEGNLFDVVIDATGNTASMAGAIEYVAHTGRLVFVGIVTDDIAISDPKFHAREATLLASRNALPEDFQRVIDSIESGNIDTQPWITHRTELDQLSDVFASYTRPETGVIKAIVAVP